jgi:hypothetical protein
MWAPRAQTESGPTTVATPEESEMSGVETVCQSADRSVQAVETFMDVVIAVAPSQIFAVQRVRIPI